MVEKRTINDICVLLGVSRTAVVTWRRKHGIKSLPRSEREPVIVKHKAQRAAERLGYKDVADCIRKMVRRGKTRLEIAKRLGVSTSTLQNHTPDDIRGYTNYTDPVRRLRAENARRMNEQKKATGWYDDPQNRAVFMRNLEKHKFKSKMGEIPTPPDEQSS